MMACRIKHKPAQGLSIKYFKMKEGLNDSEQLDLVEKIVEYFSTRNIPININIQTPELMCNECGYIESEDFWVSEFERFQIKKNAPNVFELCTDGDHVQCPNCSKISHIEDDLKEVD